MDENKELLEYIKTRQEQGASLVEITNELKGSGWEQKDIDEAVKSISGSRKEEILDPISIVKPKKQKSQFEEVRSSKKKISTYLGLFIILLATIVSVGVWWYGFSHVESDVDQSSDSILDIEELTQEIETYNYEIREDGVYYDGNLISWANPKTFIEDHGERVKKLAEHKYFISRNDNVYFKYYLLEGVDSKTIEYIGCDHYVKDKRNIYIGANKIEDAKIRSFECFDDEYSGYSKDSRHVYDGCYIIPNVNPEFFVTLRYGFAKDNVNVYSRGDIVEGADLSTFQALNSFYAKDKNNAYYYLFVIEGAHSETFEIVGLFHAKDKNFVYSLGRIFEGADSATFEYLGSRHSKDKDHVYAGRTPLEGVDVATFHYIDGNYFKDTNYIYYRSSLSEDMKTIDDVDIETFKVLTEDIEGYDYAKDKNHVYRKGEILDGLDAASFEIVGRYGYSWYVKDKNHVYDDREMVEGVDPKNCTTENLSGCEAGHKPEKEEYLSGVERALAEARNIQRSNHVDVILNAIHMYARDNDYVFPATIPTVTECVYNDSTYSICVTGIECTVGVDLSVLTDNEGYLISIPLNPEYSADTHTGYSVVRLPSNRISVCAEAELGEDISVTR